MTYHKDLSFRHLHSPYLRTRGIPYVVTQSLPKDRCKGSQSGR